MDAYAIVVVTYLPGREDILNLSRLAEASALLVIVDNSGPITPFKMEIKRNVVRINNNNIGLAAALNKGIETACQYGFESIFLFDQDSRVDSSFFKEMIDFKKKLKNRPFAFCVPNFFDRNSKTYARFPILNRFNFIHETCPAVDDFVHGRLLIAITSGTLITYQNFKLIGPFKENYFIDFIDNEYCLRAFLKGLYVAVNCKATINHSIGLRSVRSFFGLKIKPNNHHAVRRYYIARNGMRTALDYLPYSYSYAILIVLRLTHEILSVILFEKNKNRKLTAIFSGLRDGLMKNMGKALETF